MPATSCRPRSRRRTSIAGCSTSWACPPEACLAFEDSDNGLRASRGAGLATIVTVNDYTVDHDFTGATVVLSDLGEPTQPFRRLSGDAGSAVCADLRALRHWHSTARGR